MTIDRYRVCFLFNAQLHQVAHGVPTAVALARKTDFAVSIISPRAENIEFARDIAAAMGGAPIQFQVRRPLALSAVNGVGARKIGAKIMTLALLRSHLEHVDAIAVPERTSTNLRRMGLLRPLYIHLDHGAGDGAAGFDRRIALFDFVLLAGAKQRERMARHSLIRHGSYAVVGYPKFEAADAVRDRSWNPFPDKRPIVLYTPHHSELGSWSKFGPEVLRIFAQQDEFNLIFAPHIRLFGDRSLPPHVTQWLSLATKHPRIHVDLGSRRSADMTYTELADIYLGDVSSQVYEFIRRPRPCLFLDAHEVVDWQDNENYGHWRFGRVLRSTTGLINMLREAQAVQAKYEPVQRSQFARTFASGTTPPSIRAARAIEGCVRARVLPPSMIAKAARGRTLEGVAPSREHRLLRHPLSQIAAAALLVTAGWLGRSISSPAPPPAESFAHEADELHDASQGGGSARDYLKLASKNNIVLPRIPADWRVTSASLVSSDFGPSVQVTALTANGVRLTIVASNVPAPRGDSIVLSDGDDDSIASWGRAGRSYAIVGTTSRKLIRSFAADLYSSQRTS